VTDVAREVAIGAVRAGGEVVRAGLGRADLGIVEKDASRTSIVTWADLASQEAIVDVIHSSFPDEPIVGEEGSVGGDPVGAVWYVDPLDGTTNYAHGFPFYCVSVARCDAQGVTVAVVYDPFREDLFVATRGGGAFHNDQPMTVSKIADVRASLLSTQVQADDPAALDRYAPRARQFVAAARAHRAVGAPGLALAYVARGWLDAFCEPDMRPWDTAAGTLLVEEAGGRVTTFDGEPRPLAETADILATNGLLHEQLTELLAAERSGTEHPQVEPTTTS
jgi:myo-inositol-1(or 4)-monophosphatase